MNIDDAKESPVMLRENVQMNYAQSTQSTNAQSVSDNGQLLSESPSEIEIEPGASSNKQTIAETLTAIATATSTEQMNQTLSVLIVEDDPVFSHLVCRYLKRDTKHQYSITSCITAQDAKVMCLKRAYDVLLIDNKLPDMNGTQLINDLRSSINGLPPPTILLATESSLTPEQIADKSNACDVLFKQFVSPSSLSRAIRNAILEFNLRKVINERSTELECANRELIAKNREIRDYYQKVSHEVKTPLAAAREFISIVRDEILGPLNDEQKEVIDLAVTSCDQISNHFNDLVQITRLDTGKVLLRKNKTTIEHVVRRAVAATAAAMAASGIKLYQDIENPKATCYMDADRITQVLSNLIGNAVKFTESGGTVGVSVHTDEKGSIEFHVSDTGCGIAEKHRSKIFERLYQVLDETHEFQGAGLGLGLTIASEIVQLHHGEIWVESTLGVGSQFFFKLPNEELQDNNNNRQDAL